MIQRFWLRYVAAVAIAMSAVALRYALDPLLEERSPLLFSTLAVIIAAGFGGPGPGLVATGLSGLGSLYCLMGASGYLSFSSAAGVTQFVLFLLVGIGISFTIGRLAVARARELEGRQKERLFRATFENAAVGITHSDSEGRMLLVNQRFCDMLGQTKEQLHNQCLHDLTHADDLAQDRSMYHRMFAGEFDHYSIEKRYRHHSGLWIWVTVTRTIDRPPGLPPYSINISQDVTARRRAENELRLAETRLRYHLENSPVGAIEWDEEFRVRSWSKSAERIFGWKEAEVIGKHPDELHLIYEADYVAVAEVMRDLVTNRPARSYSLNRNYRSDGSVIYCQWYNSAMVDEQDRIVSLHSLVMDVTERTLAERRVRESEQRFRELADAMPQIVWTAGPDGRADYYNERFFEATAAPRGDLNAAWETVLHPEDRERAAKVWAEAVRNQRGYQDQFRVYNVGSGEYRWYLGRATPTCDEEGRVLRWYGTFTDIDDQRRAQDAAANANLAKDHFLAVLSHELRTPLTPVIAAAGMLQDDARLPEEARQDMQMIRRNVELEKRLIDDLLDLTRISRGKLAMQFRPVDVGTVMRRAVEVCEPDMHEKQLHLTLDLPEHPLLVSADEARLQQVYWNLIHNAVKFTSSGGRLVVRCTLNSADHVVAEVTDTGIGIEPKAIARIFGAFEQQDRDVTRQFGGLGLGLAICKAIVEQHGGLISARSAGRGMGATFTVELPGLPQGGEQKPESEMPAAPAALATGRKLVVLLVEDHADTARIMQRLLRREGYDVLVAGDVATAKTIAGEHPIDLVISDLGLPDGNGLELMRHLRMQYPDLCGIAISGYGQEADIRNSHEAGFAEHVTKPVDVTQLLSAVRSVTAVAKA